MKPITMLKLFIR